MADGLESPKVTEERLGQGEMPTSLPPPSFISLIIFLDAA